MSKLGHRKFRLFAHVTWHTVRRARSIRQEDVETVTRGILAAAARSSVHVLAQATLTDHVHVLVSFRPDRSLMPFIREAKSESARQVNAPGGGLLWGPGDYPRSASPRPIPPPRTDTDR